MSNAVPTMVHPTERDPRWKAIVDRDPSADGRFYYAVRTTGVYCHPSCPARRPRPQNVSFHRSCDDAEASGFRPCRRCKPRDPIGPPPHTATVEALCRFIEAHEGVPSLAALASHVGLSPSHTHRLFRRITGVTPKQYAVARRRGLVHRALRTATTTTEAIYEAGYASPSRFYANARETLGMAPADVREGGANLTIQFAIAGCSLGRVLVATTSVGVCAILLGDTPEELAEDLIRRFPAATLQEAGEALEAAVVEVVRKVENPATRLDLPLDIQGTAFQQRVWTALMEVPAGATTSYAALATRVADPRAARAVAGACAANPLAVAIPCHRVVRKDGALSGYRWGIERKRELLERERQEPAPEVTPCGARRRTD